MKFYYWIVLVILSGFVIFFQFNLIPINIAPDEIAFTRLALFLEKSPFLLYTPLETGHSTLYFYILLLSFKVFGTTLFALRVPSAMFGMLNGLLVYILFATVFKQKHISMMLPFKKILNVDLAFILALIFIFMRWHFNFARFSFEATFLLFLELISLICTFKFFENKKWSYLLGAIFFAALAFYSYTPGRIFLIVPLAVLFFAQTLMDEKKKIITFFLIWLCLIAPLIVQMGGAGGDARVGEEFILFDSSITATGKLEYLLHNIKNTVLMFGFTGDMNGRHNYPGKAALNPILFVFFIVGLFLSLRRRNMYDAVFLVWMGISILPTLLTHPSGNPNMLRTFTVIVPVVYFVGVFVDQYKFVIPNLIGNLYKSPIGIDSRFRGNDRVVILLNKYISFIIIFILIISAVYELRTYFVFQKEVTRHSFEVKKSFEWVKERDFQLTGKWYLP